LWDARVCGWTGGSAPYAQRWETKAKNEDIIKLAIKWNEKENIQRTQSERKPNKVKRVNESKNAKHEVSNENE
jgi:hypothetical protein